MFGNRPCRPGGQAGFFPLRLLQNTRHRGQSAFEAGGWPPGREMPAQREERHELQGTGCRGAEPSPTRQDSLRPGRARVAPRCMSAACEQLREHYGLPERAGHHAERCLHDRDHSRRACGQDGGRYRCRHHAGRAVRHAAGRLQAVDDAGGPAGVGSGPVQPHARRRGRMVRPPAGGHELPAVGAHAGEGAPISTTSSRRWSSTRTTLDPADNVEEYAVLGEQDLQFIVRSVEAASPHRTRRRAGHAGHRPRQRRRDHRDRPQAPQGDPQRSRSGTCRR